MGNVDPDRIQRGLVATWTLYLGWFVWFYGAQVLLLYLRIEATDGPGQRLSAILWMVYNASGIVITGCVAFYTFRLQKMQNRVGFPIAFAAVGACLNAISLAGNCVLWHHIYVRALHL